MANKAEGEDGSNGSHDCEGARGRYSGLSVGLLGCQNLLWNGPGNTLINLIYHEL